MSDAAEANTMENLHPSLSTNDDRPNEGAVILDQVLGANTGK